MTLAPLYLGFPWLLAGVILGLFVGFAVFVPLTRHRVKSAQRHLVESYIDVCARQNIQLLRHDLKCPTWNDIFADPDTAEIAQRYRP